MNTATERSLDWTERGLVPDIVIRKSIHRLLKTRLEEIQAADCEQAMQKLVEFVSMMDRSPIAVLTEKANEQHYEVPAVFYQYVLGQHRKYSSCYWDAITNTLDDAEALALKLTCEHAAIGDGLKILELGCGWGSLTLWIARHFPRAQVTGVSNSASQRQYILSQANAQGLRNIQIITADMNHFSTEHKFDRIVSVEMFEHMRNYRKLFKQVAGWLNPDGKFFMHIFCHRSTPYLFEVRDPTDWMSQYFFSGGMMPSDDLPLRFQDHLALVQQWRWEGTHYQKTANAWLNNMDQRRDKLWPVIEQIYGRDNTMQWWMRWRMFFMACAELFGHNHGQEWWVSHYLFTKRR